MVFYLKLDVTPCAMVMCDVGFGCVMKVLSMGLGFVASSSLYVMFVGSYEVLGFALLLSVRLCLIRLLFELKL